MNTSEKVIEYIRKNNCQISIKWQNGLRQYRILKDGEEKNYPRVNEDIFCDISDKIERVSVYENSGADAGVYQLIK